jgi:hypothetical protein
MERAARIAVVALVMLGARSAGADVARVKPHRAHRVNHALTRPPQSLAELSKINLGVVAGPGANDRRPGVDTTGTVTAGVEAEVVVGRDHGGLSFIGGVLGTDATSDAESARMLFPLGFGVSVQPGYRRTRFDLGIAAMFALAVNCSDCRDGFGGRAHAGVDLWLRPALGVSVAAIVQVLSTGYYTDHGIFGPDGHRFSTPRVMVRVSLLLGGPHYRR